MHDPEGNEFRVELGPADPARPRVADGRGRNDGSRQMRVNERTAMRGPRRAG